MAPRPRAKARPYPAGHVWHLLRGVEERLEESSLKSSQGAAAPAPAWVAAKRPQVKSNAPRATRARLSASPDSAPAAPPLAAAQETGPPTIVTESTACVDGPTLPSVPVAQATPEQGSPQVLLVAEGVEDKSLDDHIQDFMTEELELVDKAKAAMAASTAGSDTSAQATLDEVELKAAFDEGLGLRTRWGLRFARAAAGGRSDEYAGDRKAKAAFRQRWVATQLKEVLRMREQQEMSRRVDARRGTYRPFSVLYKNQGGPSDPNGTGGGQEVCRALHSAGRFMGAVQSNDRSHRIFGAGGVGPRGA